MITLTSATNALTFKKLQKEVWFVMISYYDALDSSDVWIFRDYKEAQKCLDKLIPSDEDVELSETVRVQHKQIDRYDPDYIHDRNYYLENGYYEHWIKNEWDDSIMDYYCYAQKYIIKDTWDGVF